MRVGTAIGSQFSRQMTAAGINHKVPVLDISSPTGKRSRLNSRFSSCDGTELLSLSPNKLNLLPNDTINEGSEPDAISPADGSKKQHEKKRFP